jgi:hypothetical protein
MKPIAEKTAALSIATLTGRTPDSRRRPAGKAIIGWKTAQIVTSQNACDWLQWLCDCSVSAAAP